MTPAPKRALACVLACVVVAVLAGCTVSRDIPPEAFACRTGGTCADARVGDGAAPDADAGLGDAVEGLADALPGDAELVDGEGPGDAPPSDGEPSADAEPLDGGGPGDAPPNDGEPFADAEPLDGEGPADAAPGDGGPADAPVADAAPSDAPLADGGPSDAAPSDAPLADAGPSDAGRSDAPLADAAPSDAPLADAAPVDASPVDTGVPADAGVADAGLCTSAVQCGGATICWNGRCERPCSADGGIRCTTGVCDPTSGRCVDELPLHAECLLDSDCTSETCLSFRVGGSSQQRCSVPCSASGNCPLDFACLDVSGMGYCINEGVFTNRAFDTPAGGFCATGNIACQSGWCSTGAMRCIESCSRPADCAGFTNDCYAFRIGANSYTNLCVVPTGTITAGNRCAFDDQCRTGVCDVANARCASHCCGESDCGPDEGCRVYPIDTNVPVKVCRPRISSGPAPAGASCTQPSDCLSEQCVPADAAAPNGPRVCSTTCCRDTDCAVLPGSRCRSTPGVIGGTLLGVCLPR